MDGRPVPAPASTGLPRFARGFIVSVAAFEPPVQAWVSQEIAGLWISRALEVPLTMARSGGRFVVVIGHFVDTETWLSTEAAVSLAAEALARSEGELLDTTDAWSGRYVVIFGVETDRHVMTDATGMRSVFYALDGSFILASHCRLVATLTGAGSPILNARRTAVRAIVPPRRRRLVVSLPGRSTPWPGVVYLTANMVLDIETRRLRRVFPRRPLGVLTTTAASALIAPRLRGQVDALVDSGRPVAISVTGGVDSRVTVAASRDVRDAVRYFTYRVRDVPGNDEDVAAASSIADAMRLPHGVVEVPPSIQPPELDAVMREATFLSHGRRIVAAYRAAFSPDTIHIRSNIGEVGRCYYRRSRAGAVMPTSPTDISASDLARLWAHGEASEPLVESFAEWMTATSFRGVQDIDALDLFYWEHRMSCWHSNVVLESDFAFDTHSLFNSRWVLERTLSVSIEDRCRGSVFRHLVAEMWPELAALPMGGGQDPRDRVRRKRTWLSVLVSLRRRMGPARRTDGRR